MIDHMDNCMKEVAQDVIIMLSMPGAIVTLHFESEIGCYFAVTSKWHASPGELFQRSGFRIMELHGLFFEFMAPYWEKAKKPRASSPPLSSS